MRWVFGNCKLYVIIRGTRGKNGFQNGELEGSRAIIAAKTPPDNNTIKVIHGVLSRILIPVQFLEPVAVTIPRCDAIVTHGPLCGRVVKVMKVNGDDATIRVEDGSTAQLNTMHLCKFTRQN